MNEISVQHLRAELDRLQDRIQDIADNHQEERIRRAEDLGEVRVSIRTVETRLKVLEDGMGRLMTHSTWLLRLLVGGFLAAFLQFAMQGGFADVLK